MSCLLIDAGNSRIKWRLLEAGDVLSEGSHGWDVWRDGATAAWHAITPKRIVLASVAGTEREEALAALCHQLWQLDLELLSSSAVACGLRNAYQEPGRLGIDRWAAMVGAYHRVKGAVLVIDAGSAITCDLIDDQGHHLGGLIAPGINAMGRALGGNVQLSWEGGFSSAEVLGTDTRTCMYAGIGHALRGIVNGACAAMVDAGIERYETLLCGGDAAQLLPLFDNARRVDGLVFEGMVLLAGESLMENGKA